MQTMKTKMIQKNEIEDIVCCVDEDDNDDDDESKREKL